MKKLILFPFACLLISAPAQAHEDSVYLCGPREKLVNELQIKSLKLEISNDNPETYATIEFTDGKIFESLLDYESVEQRYEGYEGYDMYWMLKRFGEVGIFLTKNNDEWSVLISQLEHEGLSDLDCVEQSKPRLPAVNK